jgi:hypothetical protein
MTRKQREILEVIALTDHEWRVCDGRIPQSDPTRILGYIEHCPTGFEVLALSPAPLTCGLFDCWDTALEALLDESRRRGKALAE